MRILLLDADRTRFGNLALMKIAAWHKAKGDEVWLNFPLLQSDIVYLSCVFPKNWDHLEQWPWENALIGGSGSPVISVCLEARMENIRPDYSLYGLKHSMGFTSRGCIRRCPWCIVPEKEGDIKAWADIYEFWDPSHNKIKLLDNNLLAAPNWKDTLCALIKERLSVDFNQGLDIRLLDDEKAYYLARVRMIDSLRFSFDLPAMERDIREGIKVLNKAGIPSTRVSFYVLLGFNTTFEDDKVRLETLKELGCEAFPMFYTDLSGKQHVPARAEAWINMPRGSRRQGRKYLRLASGR